MRMKILRHGVIVELFNHNMTNLNQFLKPNFTLISAKHSLTHYPFPYENSSNILDTFGSIS